MPISPPHLEDHQRFEIDFDEHYISEGDVCALIPGMTTGRLKMLRFNGTGPEYLKPTPKTVVYSERRVREWLERTARTSTREAG
ncbi:hypothetical protein [Curtobacterium sp. GD1]|uniref:hypothetical protein n=1 Tax=Curtobacterium sp. GD1 TaxID=2810612 RepID=UPI001E4D44ED|nr:hypothetical protein [Curtobacterium sp. GD1]MCC8909458.1 hypothetical protein [Curtobacterium sp. GD1]